MTTKEWFSIWLDDYAGRNIKLRTYARYREIIERHINPFFGEMQLEEVTADDAGRFLSEKLERGNLITGERLSASSVNSILAVLKTAFDCAADIELIIKSPCRGIKRVKSDEKEVEAFTVREQKRIERAVIISDDERLFGIILCLYTGLRIGELLALTWENLDFVKKTISVKKTICRVKDKYGIWREHIENPKTRSSDRIIPIPSVFMHTLREMKHQTLSGYVIENKGKNMAVRSYQFIFSSLLEKNDIRHRGFHSLRHTFATRAVENGMDFKTLSEIMGHKNAMITINRYSHSMLETKRKALNKLAKIY